MMMSMKADNKKWLATVFNAAAGRLGVSMPLAKKAVIISHYSLFIFILCACSTIDDDLSACGNEYELDYELRLVTNMTTELQTVLETQTEVPIANALRAHLADIFTDYAHDVDLSFYDTQGDSLRLHHDKHIMDANQASYTLFLPMREYQHLAVANVVNNPIVGIAEDERCHTSMLHQTVNDTIPSHTTGLFTARQPMEVLEGVDQTFNVRLYMANCAAALVIDPRGHDISNLRVYTTGFAKQFNICDSIYTFAEKDPIVRTSRLVAEGTDKVSYCSVNFPSRDPAVTEESADNDESAGAPSTRTIIETEEPFISESEDHTLWKFVLVQKNADNTLTMTEFGLTKPLRAGQLKILEAYANDDGSFTTVDVTVGVSVTLDWHQGGTYNPEL